MPAPVPLPFGVLERRMVTDVVSHLATATVVWYAGGRVAGTPVEGIRGIFDDAYSGQLDGMVVDSDPTCTVQARDCPGIRRGDGLDVFADEAPSVLRAFEVIKAMPDGIGGVVLDLREVAP